MSFVIFTDSSANLTPDLAAAWDARVIPLHTQLEGDREYACFGEDIDLHAYYDQLRHRRRAHTSMINSAQFEAAFEPVLAEGNDILYIGMSSGISGTVQAARVAGEELCERLPGRVVRVVDTLAASFGEGLFVERAYRLRESGHSLEECARWCEEHVQQMNQFLAVDDLIHMKNGGRISGIAALAGTIIRLKPVLFGNAQGRFSMADKSLGRKKSLKFLSDITLKRLTEPEKTLIGIAHADCEADALAVADAIRARYPKQEFVIRCYEPGTGAHTGADAVAIFFFGEKR